MKYAACTMCKNEEHNVALWLERTKDFDYRVVVDTGSTDNTVKLFEESDVIFSVKEFRFFKFDVVRNHVMSKVPSDVDWLFWPDMDEEYEPNWKYEMCKIIAETPDVTRVLHKSIHYRNGVFEGGCESGTPIDSKIHKHGKYYLWEKPIHEHLIPLGKEIVVSTDKIVRHHYHYDRKWVDDLCIEIGKRAVEEDPTDSWNTWSILRDSYQRKNWNDVIKYGEIYLNTTTPYTDFRSLAHMFVGEALWAKSKIVKKPVLISLLRSVAENPDNAKAWGLYNRALSQKL